MEANVSVANNTKHSQPGSISAMDSIPPEIFSKVFSHMAQGGISLSSCVLVCRYWADIAYLHHFETLRYTISTGSERTTWKPGEGKPTIRSYNDLIAFLGASPRISSCVKVLRIRGIPRCDFDALHIPEFIQILPNMHALAMENFDVTHSEGDPFRASTSLLALQLGHNSSVSPRGLGFILTCFTEIALLDLEGLDVDNAVFQEHMDINPPAEQQVGVQKLRLGDNSPPTNEAIFSLLRRLIDPSSFTALSVLTPVPESPTVLGDFLQTHGAHLEELTFESLDLWESARHSTLILSSCTRLRYLEVPIYIICKEIHAVNYTNFAAQFWMTTLRLLHIAPTTVHHMRLRVKLQLCEDFDFVDPDDYPEEFNVAVDPDKVLTRLEQLNWSPLDRAIETHPALEVVEISVEHPFLQWVDGTDLNDFYQRFQRIVVAKCFATDARQKLLRLSFPV